MSKRQTASLKGFVAAVDALAVPASLHDPEGRFVHMNNGAERASGFSNAQTVGRHVTALVSPDDRKHVEAQFRHAVEDGQPADFGTAFIDAEGNNRYTRAQHLPLIECGRLIGMLVLAWEAPVPPSVAGAHRLPQQLPPRQLEVLRLVASGWSTREIANELGLAQPTVRNYVRDALAQLGAHRRDEAVVKAQRAGLLALRPLEPVPTEHTPSLFDPTADNFPPSRELGREAQRPRRNGKRLG